jgi:hypothetical protein
VDRDGGGAGAALDPAGGDDQGAAAGSGRLGGAGRPGELAGEVGGAVGPGEQAAGAGLEGGPQVGGPVVVADGEQRDAAAGGEVGEHRAADQGDRRAGGERGGEAGRPGLGDGDAPAGGGLDGVAQGVGGAGVVVGDDDQRQRRWDGFEGHGHPPGGVVVGGRRGKDGRAPRAGEGAGGRMCITKGPPRPEMARFGRRHVE